ncbi:MAG: flagellar biosynthesis anti-sigma factor FlgM [Sedimentisphaerales bacterium]|nr:flagellar biosynthesis anti-sigma factor FlgM [Sedimentisphaerales bacterium]
MNNISRISGNLTTIPSMNKLDSVQRYQEQQSKPSYNSGNDNDQVEISQRAMILSKISELPDIRQEKVDQLRKQLADGSYDIDSKLSLAFDKFFEEEAIL